MLRRFPTSSVAQLVAGVLRFVDGAHEASFAAFERAVVLNPKAAQVAYGLAFERAMRLGQLRRAAAIAERAKTMNEPVRWMQARFAIAIALDEDPAELGAAILAIEPDVPDVLVELAKLHLRRGRPGAALQLARRIDAFRSGDASLAEMRVALMRAAGAAEEADREASIARQSYDAFDEPELDLSVRPPHRPPWTPAEDRRRARAMLDPSSVAVARSRTEGRALDDESVERLCERGFVCVPGALDRTARERWLMDAQRRLRADPARWVKGYAGGLEDYDPDDPATWTIPRVDLLGDERAAIAELAPDAWRAIAQLLGGEARVATRHWSSYFIINFGERDEPRYKPPEPGDPHWHVDAPHALRWGAFKQALVGFVLFTDLAPRAGGTFLAAGSHRTIARALRDGADMTDRTVARAVSHEHDAFELTGRAGDVVLAHALLVHAASPNPWGVARFMANPLIEATTPLDPDGGAPVERAMR